MFVFGNVNVEGAPNELLWNRSFILVSEDTCSSEKSKKKNVAAFGRHAALVALLFKSDSGNHSFVKLVGI